MKIEQVRLLRTLKAGKNVWVEGSYFPNNQYPSIPHDLLLEVALNTGTVEVTKKSEENVIKFPEQSSTSTSHNAVTSVQGRASLEEALIKEKQEIESAEVHEPKRKSKLVRRS
jgi:hypothetical protein